MTSRTKIVLLPKKDEKNVNTIKNQSALVVAQPLKRRKRKSATDPTLSGLCLDPSLEDLVRLRVAQIHECEWSMHEQTKKMKARGERTFRLGLLKEWRTQMIFSDRARHLRRADL
jgi:alkylhydroperoxidase family enzyme